MNQNSLEHKKPSGLDLEFNELVIWYGRRSWKSMIGSIISLAIILIFFTIIGFEDSFFMAIGLIIYLTGMVCIVIAVISTEYVITDRRISSRFGLVGRKTNEASFERIQDTEFVQGWGGRLLDYGNVGVRTAGTKGSEINFTGVSEPKWIQRMIRDMIGRAEEDREVRERIIRFEDKYMLGEISKQEFEQAKQRLLININRDEGTTYYTGAIASQTSIPYEPSSSSVYDDGSYRPKNRESVNYTEEQEKPHQPRQFYQQSPSERLNELKIMKDKHLITEEEFEKKKKEILESL